ncbi:effector-associated constant component EACC1 [Symbioplanes lichenis]|uniref:effector-associated constant component EACC1 n=1 Tax=Symbioplanes lichenis TaxID=1629072 RepID=UPI0027392115|nr:hypothetical protein [Actinoplanes lichenis]
MRVSITVVGQGGPEALRHLRSRLRAEPALRGRVTDRELPPAPGTLGPVLDAVLVALGPGGVAAALVTGLVSWLRHERADLSVRVERADGSSFELTAQRVKGLDAAGLRAEIAALARAVEAEAAEDRTP